jgi:hypothetical protein
MGVELLNQSVLRGNLVLFITGWRQSDTGEVVSGSPQPCCDESGGRPWLSVVFIGRSGRFRCPTPRACRLASPIGATAGEVLTLADQALVELAGEQGDLVVTEVMAKRTASEADLLAAAGD